MPGFENEMPALESEIPYLESDIPDLETELPALESELPGLECDQPPDLECELPGLVSDLPALEQDIRGFESNVTNNSRYIETRDNVNRNRHVLLQTPTRGKALTCFLTFCRCHNHFAPCLKKI